MERILVAAAEILDESGAGAVTMRAIATRAEVPVATIYQFFTDRDSLIEELIFAEMVKREEQFARELDGRTPESVEEAVDLVLTAHRRVFGEHPTLVSAYYAADRRARAPVIAEHRRRLAETVRTIAVDAGLLDPSTPRVVTELAVEIGDRGIEFATTSPADADQILMQTRLAIIAYLTAAAGRPPE